MAESKLAFLHAAFSLVRGVSRQVWTSEDSSLMMRHVYQVTAVCPGLGQVSPILEMEKRRLRQSWKRGETALDSRLSPKYLALNTHLGRCGLSLFLHVSHHLLSAVCQAPCQGWGCSLEGYGGLGLQGSVMGTLS